MNALSTLAAVSPLAAVASMFGKKKDGQGPLPATGLAGMLLNKG